MEAPSSDGAAPDAAQQTPTAREPNTIQHMPRQRAKPPMLTQTEAALRRAAAAPEASGSAQLSRDQVSHAYDVLEQQRIGPYIVKYGCISSVGVIAYTYMRGFYHLAQKNRDAWVGTFRHRIYVMGPLIAMYVTANGIVPLPYKDKIEAALNRPCISMYDIVTAKETVRKAQTMPLKAQV